MKKIYLVVSMMLAGCSLTSNEEIVSNVYLKNNELANLGRGITIIVSNISDSRCPEGCCCFWAGEARVYFTISTPFSRLDTNLVLPSQIYFEDHTISLVSVEPYPKCDSTPVDQSAKFLVEHQK